MNLCHSFVSEFTFLWGNEEVLCYGREKATRVFRLEICCKNWLYFHYKNDRYALSHVVIFFWKWEIIRKSSKVENAESAVYFFCLNKIFNCEIEIGIYTKFNPNLDFMSTCTSISSRITEKYYILTFSNKWRFFYFIQRDNKSPL